MIQNQVKGNFAYTLLFLLWSGTILFAQKDKIQAQRDSFYNVLQEYLARNSIDSALATTDALYKFHVENENLEDQVRTKIHRAEILRAAGSLDLAFETLKAVNDDATALPSSTIKSYYYNRLGAIEFERKNKEEAIRAVKESQRIDSLKNYKWRIFSNLNILGSIYRDQEKWDLAVNTLEVTIQKAEEANDSNELYQAIRNISMVYERMGEYRKAIEAAFRYQNYKTPAIAENFISDNFRIIASSYKSLGIIDSAYQFLDSAHKHTLHGLQDMVLQRTDGYRIANELEKQRLENSVLIAEKEKSQLQSLMLVIVLIFIILLAFVFFRQKQGYKKLNAKQQELNQELGKSLAFKDQLIGIVAHDIRNPMSSLTGVIHLYNEGFIGRDDLKDMMSKLEASAVSVNFLIENLLNWVLNQKQALVANRQLFNISNLIDKTLKEVEAQSKAKGLSIQVYGFRTNLELISDEMMLGLVIRNLLSNAIKFSFDSAEIIVSYKEDIYGHHVLIKDFGIGMSAELIKSISSGKKETQEGTSHEKGTGLGLELSREFLKAIGGSLAIKSKKGKGTEMDIFLPLN